MDAGRSVASKARSLLEWPARPPFGWWAADNVTGAGGFLFGRRTYEVFAAHWPNASEEEQALAASACSPMTVRSGRCGWSTAR
jgi:transposase